MADYKTSTHDKAVQINLDTAAYGTFAEIGAGQETARWFFQVGGAAGTIAKSMSAYDMTFSDSIYGPSERYVSRQRLATMLDHEYALLLERLQNKRGSNTNFFVFANTVAAKAYRSNKECHGWLGVRFQRQPNSPPHNIKIHVRMLDKENLQQQEALGIIGVNLLYGAFYNSDNPDRFINSLLDSLSHDRIEIDLVLFEGPDFVHLDNRLLNLQLIRKGLTSAVVFAPGNQVLLAAEHIYNRPILVERGNFRPVTQVNLDMLDAARGHFHRDFLLQKPDVLEIMEITLRNPLNSGEMDGRDFLARVDILSALGKTVMVSNYSEFHRLGAYLHNYSRQPIGIVLGIALLEQIFDEKYYTDLDGGILESFGRLFKSGVKLYVYPALNEEDGSLITAETLHVTDHLRNLYKYLLNNKFIIGITGKQPKSVTFSSGEVAGMIGGGDPAWEKLVSPEVAQLIKANGYFNFKESAKG